MRIVSPSRSGIETAVVTAAVVMALTTGWSCLPGPADSDVRIELVQSAWLEDTGTLLLVTSVREDDPYRTHGRLELSWLDPAGRELFRGLYNTSSRANPVPPEAFGVFDLEDDSVMSAGIEADRDVTHGGFTLLTDSATARWDGVLSVSWAIRPPMSLVGRAELRARVIPTNRDTGEWQSIGRLELDEGSWRVVEETAAEAESALHTGMNDREPEAALRSLGELWDQGADPKTIGEIRTRALEKIGMTGRYSVGSETYLVRDLQTVYEWMLMIPDVLRHRIEVGGDLEPGRFLHLAVAAGREHADPAQEHSEYVIPAIDLPEALQNPDPWVVSAALFMARKQQIELDAEEILARWQGPRAWDEVCTEQALLYLAARRPGELAAAMLVNAPGRLEEADPDGVEIRPWLFLASGDWSAELVTLQPGNGLVLEVRDSTMDVISRRPVASGESALKLSSTANYYSFSYLDGSMHGASRFVDGKAGVFVRMAIGVEGGV